MVVLISACLKADALATVNLAKASEPFGWQLKDHICSKPNFDDQMHPCLASQHD